MTDIKICEECKAREAGKDVKEAPKSQIKTTSPPFLCCKCKKYVWE